MSFACVCTAEVIEDASVQYVQTSGILPLRQVIKSCMVAFAKFRCPELDVNAILANDYRKLV